MSRWTNGRKGMLAPVKRMTQSCFHRAGGAQHGIPAPRIEYRVRLDSAAAGSSDRLKEIKMSGRVHLEQ